MFWVWKRSVDLHLQLPLGKARLLLMTYFIVFFFGSLFGAFLCLTLILEQDRRTNKQFSERRKALEREKEEIRKEKLRLMRELEILRGQRKIK
jgi:hypothetical protein